MRIGFIFGRNLSIKNKQVLRAKKLNFLKAQV